MIRGMGFSVWSLVSQFRINQGDKERTLASYGGDLTSEELDAALSFYWAKPHSIDEKLKEIDEHSYLGPSDVPVMLHETSSEHLWRQYIDEHSSRGVPVIRDKGMSVWSLVGYFRLFKGDKERLVGNYRGHLTIKELDAAIAYYWAKPYAIEQKLKEISTYVARFYLDEDIDPEVGRILERNDHDVLHAYNVGTGPYQTRSTFWLPHMRIEFSLLSIAETIRRFINSGQPSTSGEFLTCAMAVY